MKFEGTLQGFPIYSSPDCPEGYLYIVNENLIRTVYPKKKNGRPDMRYSINKLQSIFDKDFPNKIIKL